MRFSWRPGWGAERPEQHGKQPRGPATNNGEEEERPEKRLVWGLALNGLLCILIMEFLEKFGRHIGEPMPVTECNEIEFQVEKGNKKEKERKKGRGKRKEDLS